MATSVKGLLVLLVAAAATGCEAPGQSAHALPSGCPANAAPDEASELQPHQRARTSRHAHGRERRAAADGPGGRARPRLPRRRYDPELPLRAPGQDS